MPIDLATTGVFRIIPIQNLEHDLRNGLYCKNNAVPNLKYVTIGSAAVISRRDTAPVTCYPGTVVNDYVPFYFSVRTPMLYNIITGKGVPSFPQKDIIYLCCKLSDLAAPPFQWCYTDGNAATAITKFFRNLQNIDSKVDWRSVNTTDFRDENEDGDEDRVRKKHAEFLVRDCVPTEYIQAIVVINDQKKTEVEAILTKLKLNIKVVVNPNKKYYFL